MFINNKYKFWYFDIIDNACQRVPIKEEYYETHHIIPKSLSGDNSKLNLVKLTGKEHFICHHLLIKMTTGADKKKMQFALNSFRRTSKNQNRYKLTARQYEIVRKEVSEARSLSQLGNKFGLGSKRTAEQKAAMSVVQTGIIKRPRTQEEKEYLSKINTGIKRTEETKQKMRVPKPAGFGELIRKARTGTKRSAATIAKLKKPKKTIQCPQCGKIGGAANMKRYHFENCKHK